MLGHSRFKEISVRGDCYMSIFSSPVGIIDKYGIEVTVATDNHAVKAKAFIQPLRYNSRYYGEAEHHKAGFVRNNKYLYIGKPDVEIISGSLVIERDKTQYIVKRSEIYRVGEECIYTWAILSPCSKSLEDDYETDTQTA